MIAKLPKETEEQIQSLVESGEYGDSTDVVVRAVHDLAHRREHAGRMRQLLQPSIDRVQRGETVELTQELLDEKWEAALAKYYASEARNDRASS